MRIGIDARFYGPTGRGLGRYTQEIIDNIILINEHQDFPDIEFVIFLGPHNFDELEIKSDKVKKVLIKIPWYSWQEQLLFPWCIWREKLDLMHFLHFNIPILTPGKFIMTLHDLILTHFPTLRATTKNRVIYYWKNLAYRLTLKIALLRAKKIITVSKFTQKDLHHKFKTKLEKTKVIYEGIVNLNKGKDTLFIAKLNSEEILTLHHLEGKYLLYVGSAYPHKNLEMLIEVFSELHSENKQLKLVLVGEEDYFYRQIQKKAQSLNLWQKDNVNNAVVFLGYVPDVQLEIIYQRASLYIFPSLYEGFGLPPLEAMANGCPVLSSDRSSLPEVLGKAAYYFNPEDKNEILSKIKKILTDESLQNSLREKGYQQIKKYNWWEAAKETLDLYYKVLKK